MEKYPLKLRYIPRDLPWGGHALRDRFGFGRDGERIAEAWVASVRPEAVSVIENGPAAGMTLGDYVAGDPTALGFHHTGERFPVLIKLIDAGDKLSVQVHPDDGYAARAENDSGKTEMWYILRAEPGARIVYGIKDGVTVPELIGALEKGEDEKVLRCVFPKAGDVLFIPPGLVHSIGAGITLAEIQENSDLTYRIYDYDRVFDGVKRPLHTEKAADCVKYYSDGDIGRIRFSRGAGEDVICSCDRFKVRRITSRDSGGVTVTVGDDSFAALLVTGSEEGAVLSFGGEKTPLSFGDSYFVPAGTGKVAVAGGAEVLATTI